MSAAPRPLPLPPGGITRLATLSGEHDPFLTPAFLGALESSGCVGPGTAWTPSHLLFEENGGAAAVLPLYRKQDSRGEYVFDHAWAAAYHRHGLDYYPKLVTAVPFTPVPGPRLLVGPGDAPARWIPTALAAAQDEVSRGGVSGWHGLFVGGDWLAPAREAGMAVREGVRFHWTQPGYRDFDDFLDTLTSKKRKDIRRERRRLQEQGIRCRVLTGQDIDPSAWRFFQACYERTYLEHGQRPYLNARFFEALAATQAASLSLVIAEDSDGPLASALFLQAGTTLYGRYWGCLRRADGLHFEVCYYQGMELCLARGLREFDPGTQGEHKLLRGFAPVRTYSLHWLREPAFQDAILRFVREESREIDRYFEAASHALPYRGARPGERE